MNIRKANISDSIHIVELIKRCVTEMIKLGFDQWDPEYPGIQEVHNDIVESNLYLMEDSGKIIAMVTLNKHQDEEYDEINWSSDREESMVVHRLAVDPLYKRKQIGRKMMEHVEDVARKAGIKAIRLDTYSDNQAAMEFYMNLGYKQVGVVNFSRRPLPFPVFEKIL
ncbi:MAG: GNAT family N-acetyltransferase [Bacteroidia bacterium]|nr:GNAT family N-acetyltransferase [Bacteroidia bacterium]